MLKLNPIEEKALAVRLAAVSDVFDEDSALALIRSDDKFLGAKKALELIEARETSKKRQEVLDSSRARLQASALAR